jgi:hypothetical protein
MESIIDIPLRRQTYEDIYMTPQRPKKVQECPGAPERKINIFNPGEIQTKFSTLDLESEDESQNGNTIIKRRKLNNGDFVVLVRPYSENLQQNLGVPSNPSK